MQHPPLFALFEYDGVMCVGADEHPTGQQETAMLSSLATCRRPQRDARRAETGTGPIYAALADRGLAASAGNRAMINTCG